MKRSEILDEDSYLNELIYAESILSKLESFGMMPPYKNKDDEPLGYNEGYIQPPTWETE